MKVAFNSNRKLVKAIKKALKENDGYCPSKLVKAPYNKCMCEEFRYSSQPVCRCGMYIHIK